ncbi:creatininase family protein [Mangrovicoccus sp. HB161399]|uniref:creatininase family protein n=1 Tax=Mangrovicoccus sp. HB161399 TaxID=2720392 RepID=UPI0015549FC5|nr:creatininase family protein [Mangrovicoccus sp. HB161399]
MTDATPRHFAPRALIWAELTRAELAEAATNGALVLIPTGSIEQHSDHLPVETDAMLAAAVAELAAARMQDTPVVVAPAVSFGFTPHHLSWPGTISLRLETYMAMLTDIARSIIDAGFPRAIFVNGHGGNSAPLRALVGQLTTDGYPVGMVDYTAPSDPAFRAFMKGGLPRQGHACEHETAMLMDLAGAETAGLIEGKIAGLPARLIQPWIAPGHPDDPITDYGASWAAIFHADDCGYWGDPGVSTRETGAELTEVTVAKLAEFLERFARTPLRVGVARDRHAPGIAAPVVAPKAAK